MLSSETLKNYDSTAAAQGGGSKMCLQTVAADTFNGGIEECKSCRRNIKHAEGNSGYVHHPTCNKTDLDLCLHNTGAAFILWATTCTSCTAPPSHPLLIQDTCLYMIFLTNTVHL